MKSGKTVKDLIEYLKTKDQEMYILLLYDGMFTDINIFEETGSLVFSDGMLDSNYKDAKIEFTTEES